MRLRLSTCTAVLFFVLSGVSFGAGEAQKADTKAALSALETWLGPGPNRDQWEKYLVLKELHQQIDNFSDVKVLKRSLARLESGAPGLDLPEFARLHDALAAWIDAVYVPTPAEALEAVKKAATDFQPPTAAQLATAKTRLETDVKALEQYLAQLGKVGVGWRKYLDLDELHQELAAGPTPAKPAGGEGAEAATDAAAAAEEAAESRLTALWKIHANFVADAPGLEMPLFLAVGNALEEYIELAEVVEPAPADGKDTKPTLAEEYTAKLTELAKLLEEYQSKPSEELAASIDQHLGWLWRRHLDRDLVNLVRQCYGRPNLYVVIQKGLIATGVERPVDERDAPCKTTSWGRRSVAGQRP